MRVLFPITVLLVLAASPAAQMLPSGTWTGTLTDAEGNRHPVDTAIERCTAGFKLDLTVAGRTAQVPESAPATWRRGRLQFTTSRLRLPGAIVPRALVCDLRAGDDGQLGGTCTSGSREVRLALVPPTDATLGCD